MKVARLPTDATRFAKSLVNATVAMYQAAQNNLLPTPTKSHYTFNVRDVARIIQGILLVTLLRGSELADDAEAMAA